MPKNETARKKRHPRIRQDTRASVPEPLQRFPRKKHTPPTVACVTHTPGTPQKLNRDGRHLKVSVVVDDPDTKMCMKHCFVATVAFLLDKPRHQSLY